MPGFYAGHPRLAFLIAKKGVDGRDKPGHDDNGWDHYVRVSFAAANDYL